MAAAAMKPPAAAAAAAVDPLLATPARARDCGPAPPPRITLGGPTPLQQSPGETSQPKKRQGAERPAAGASSSLLASSWTLPPERAIWGEGNGNLLEWMGDIFFLALSVLDDGTGLFKQGPAADVKAEEGAEAAAAAAAGGAAPAPPTPWSFLPGPDLYLNLLGALKGRATLIESLADEVRRPVSKLLEGVLSEGQGLALLERVVRLWADRNTAGLRD
jgi:hypothetical protein